MGSRPFPTFEVSGWELMASELDGQSEHPWLRQPETGQLGCTSPSCPTERRAWRCRVIAEVSARVL